MRLHLSWGAALCVEVRSDLAFECGPFPGQRATILELRCGALGWGAVVRIARARVQGPSKDSRQKLRASMSKQGSHSIRFVVWITREIIAVLDKNRDARRVSADPHERRSKPWGRTL